MSHKIEKNNHHKQRSNIKISKSTPQGTKQFIKIQLQCFINSTNSKDYQEIKAHCSKLIKTFNLDRSTYNHIHNWLHVELNIALKKKI